MFIIYKKVGTYLLLLFSIFFMSILYQLSLTFIQTNQIILVILVILDFSLFPIFWYGYYKEEILPLEKPSLKLDGFLLLWGALFGSIFSDVFLQPLMTLSNSGDYLQTFLAILLAIFLFLISLMFVLLVHLIHGIGIKDEVKE